MNRKENINYYRIAEAIEYIRKNFKEQPSLEAMAEAVHLSPFHFQRIFREWAGVSPKKFLQFTSIHHARKLLKENRATLFETAIETGLSGTGRLHDLFINIEGMTPAEYKNGGQYLAINYSFAQTPFGKVIIASTTKGICFMSFEEDEASAFASLREQFPSATIVHQPDALQQNALCIFDLDRSNTLVPMKLHLKGTEFQLKVWEALLKIPQGQLTTYNAIARSIQNPASSRAVGNAIGSNPVAFLIPCHRVIQASGHFGGYMWGSTRKAAIIGWEAVAGYNEEE